MAKAVKVGVIGAGSAIFSLGVVRDLCLAQSLHGSTVTLMDVDQGRLEMIARLAERYVQELGIDLRFEQTLQRERALKDADFVLNTALVGGRDYEERSWQLAERHGYYRGIRLPSSFKQYELMLSVARDMERICPDAWLIQSSNPVFEGCTLITRQTGVKVIGLCHGFYGYRSLARGLGLSDEEIDQIEWEAPGVNHWIYLTQFRLRGQDLYPLLDRWIEEQSDEYYRTFKGRYGETFLARCVVDHYRRVGLIPIGDGSRLGSEWYYHTDFETKRKWWGHLGGWHSEVSRAMMLAGWQRNVERIREVALDERKKVTEAVPPEKTREIQIPIMDAIANDRPGIFQVNVPNRGAIENVAADVVVEGKALVDASGAKLLHVGLLPDKLMHLVLGPRIAKMERELAAWSLGDRDLLAGCLLLDDHRTRSLEQVEGYLDDVLAQPENEDLRQRFRRPARKALGPYTLEPLDGAPPDGQPAVAAAAGAGAGAGA